MAVRGNQPIRQTESPELRHPGVGLARPCIIGPLLFICILSGYLLSYNVDKPTHNADWYIRYQVTCQIVEHNTFSITPYRQDGRTGPGLGGLKYAQYTLGQTTALIPLYLLGRALAGLPHTDCNSLIAPQIVFLTCKMLDLLLGALLCVLFFATARLLGYGRLLSLALTFLFAFGTSLWPDVLSNLEHTMESLFLLAAAYAALRYTRQRRKQRLWIVVMGVAAGLVFVTRVSGVIVPPIFALYLLVYHRRTERATWKRSFMRDLTIFVAGVAPSILINAIYDTIRFGKPWQTGPYPDQSLGYPPWLGIPNLLISPGKGLFWYTPALFLLVLAARPFWRRFPLPAILFGLICGIYLFFYANVNYWHGDPAWGPRYLYSILPYLIVPLGEVFRCWRGYRTPVRGLIITVLAASFLVQLVAVSVSYWRHWHFIYAYHYEQVENHFWGQNLNYWWFPDQSPIVVSFEGLYDITQKYVDHAPLLSHSSRQRLSNPLESCSYRVYGQAEICVTDREELNDVYNWNTFTMWWVHTYPWWSIDTVTRLALGLVAVFVVSGGALIGLLARSARPHRARAPGPIPNGASLAGNERNGNGHEGTATLDVRSLPDVMPPWPAKEHPGAGAGTLVVEAPPLAPPVAASTPQTRTQGLQPITGLLPLCLALLLAVCMYGGIVDVAAMRAPRAAPPLVQKVPMATTVHDGMWAYRVLSVTRAPAILPGIAAPPPLHHYVVVRMLLYNNNGRPHHMRPDFFALTDRQGLRYPEISGWGSPNTPRIAQLYHLAPFGTDIPAHSVLQGVLLFQVRDSSHNLMLLGPGIALVQLDQ